MSVLTQNHLSPVTPHHRDLPLAESEVMQRIGVIDLGSNTTRLIVMEYIPQRCFRLIDEMREAVRLIEGMREDRLLQPMAMERAIDALHMFASLCHATDTSEVIAVATSAVRDAANQQEFLAEVRQRTGLVLRVLSGEEEAYYGYLGVVNSMPLTDGYIIDIGGGSTELTYVQGREFQRGVSFPVGVVRYRDRYIHSDPISKADFNALERGLEEAFAAADWLHATDAPTLVGVGGTVRNLARIDQKRGKYPLERVHGYQLSLEGLERTISTLRRLTSEERAAVPGMNRDRADVLLPGALILRHVMRRGGFGQVVVGGQALREGLFYEHFLSHQERPILADVREFSVRNLASLYNYDVRHAEKVREIALSLFDQLQHLHSFGAWERELLGHAAILHDIGLQVGYYDHHKHSAYLVLNSGLPGFTHRELALLTILVRSHRKGEVSTSEFRAVLDPSDDTRAMQLSALLRLAEYLERGKLQVVKELRLEFMGGTIIVHTYLEGDGTAEIWNANQRGGLFRKAFGLNIEIVPG